MKKVIYFLVVFLLNTTAWSAESCDLYLDNIKTKNEFVENIRLNRSDLEIHNIDNDKCKPQIKIVGILGNPICLFKDKIPVIFLSVAQIEDSDVLDSINYIMRGTKNDIEFVRSIYSDLRTITKEYKEEMKGPHFFGETYAWRDNNKIVVLGTHEPGYDPVERSLNLVISSPKSTEILGRDLNSCVK